MKKAWMAVSAWVCLAGCAGGPGVGSGAPFSSVPGEIDGVSLAGALLSGVYAAAMRDSPRSSYGKRETRSCRGGGEISYEMTVAGEDSPELSSLEVSLAECGIVMRLNGGDYNEALSGSLSLRQTAERSARLTAGISVSGDIGFSAECDITTQGSLYPGGCEFRDREGAVVDMAGEDLGRVWGD